MAIKVRRGFLLRCTGSIHGGRDNGPQRHYSPGRRIRRCPRRSEQEIPRHHRRRCFLRRESARDLGVVVAHAVVVLFDLIIILIRLPDTQGKHQEETGSRGGGGGRRRNAALHSLRVGQDAAVADGSTRAKNSLQRLWRAIQVRAARARVPAGGKPHLCPDAALQLSPQGHGAPPPEGASNSTPPRQCRRLLPRSRHRHHRDGDAIPPLRRLLTSDDRRPSPSVAPLSLCLG